MKRGLSTAVDKMIDSLKLILNGDILSMYIYGSCVLGDFKCGWSDIDILVLTKNKLSLEKANELLTLRQKLLEKEPENKYFRKFEGAILSLESFLNNEKDNVVYWGTRGEKIKDSYCLDSFSMKELIENGKLLYGQDIRSKLTKPTFEQLCKDIIYHYQTIREQGQKPGRNLYSFGWFLDISRCIYTLKTGDIISKTKAAEWALKNKLCPDKKALKVVLKVRKNPLKYKGMVKIMDYAETLGPSIQRYADILEEYLQNYTKKELV